MDEFYIRICFVLSQPFSTQQINYITFFNAQVAIFVKKMNKKFFRTFVCIFSEH